MAGVDGGVESWPRSRRRRRESWNGSTGSSLGSRSLEQIGLEPPHASFGETGSCGVYRMVPTTYMTSLPAVVSKVTGTVKTPVCRVSGVIGDLDSDTVSVTFHLLQKVRSEVRVFRDRRVDSLPRRIASTRC